MRFEVDFSYISFTFRLKLLKNSGFGDSPMKCMEYPEESEMTNLCHVSATLAAVRPGCLNNGTVEFSK